MAVFEGSVISMIEEMLAPQTLSSALHEEHTSGENPHHSPPHLPKSTSADEVPAALKNKDEVNFYLTASPEPVLSAVKGIKFDFNNGARVLLPARTTGKWSVILRDLDTGNILFQNENKGAYVESTKKYYVRFGIEIDEILENGERHSVFRHEYDCFEKNILIQIPVGTLGDTLGWFPYVAKFARAHRAHVICLIAKGFIPLFEKKYPYIQFMVKEEAEEKGINQLVYATYSLGLFFDDKDFIFQPTDFRFVGLHRTAGYILGVDPKEERPELYLEDESRPIEDPYVCIAIQASTQCKYWNNPFGWKEVVAFLKGQGYRVICIDKNDIYGSGIVWNAMPYGVEDETGDKPLTERARWLKHAEFFVGLSSGLAWLAWAMKTPVVMISGFTHPHNEFATPWRIINWHACNSCWNDPTLRFDHHDFLWCPRHSNTARQFECTKLITGEYVINYIKQLITQMKEKNLLLSKG